MKIIAVLDSVISAGGGFNQALNAIVQMQRICAGKYEFEVLTSHPQNIEALDTLGIAAMAFDYTLFDHLVERFRLSEWWRLFQARLKFMCPFEKMLIKRSCDLVYFVDPFGKAAALQKLNYISTVWDLCHRDMPEFPEVKSGDAFFRRERYLKNFLSPAIAIVVDAEKSADQIHLLYGVDREKIQPMPFGPNPAIAEQHSKDMHTVLAKYELEAGYFFYPAQFWSHKNHVRILQALSVLRERGESYRAVFVGGDQGNLAYVKSEVLRLGVGEQVRLLGFVPGSDMRGLFAGAHAIVMPSYFGPTNIPPLEAWMLDKPLIYTSWFEAQTGDAAIYVNPDDAMELAGAMQRCDDEEYCKKIVANGRKRLQTIAAEREAREKQLALRIQSFARRLECWKNPF